MLGHAISNSLVQCRDLDSAAIDYIQWATSAYRPTPTIIEAAQTLYAGNSVQEISRSHAGAQNLTATTQAVLQATEDARKSGSKLICFITGVPGAGKTLAGLNEVPALDGSDFA